jgi:hypothetical protein
MLIPIINVQSIPELAAFYKKKRSQVTGFRSKMHENADFRAFRLYRFKKELSPQPTTNWRDQQQRNIMPLKKDPVAHELLPRHPGINSAPKARTDSFWAPR